MRMVLSVISDCVNALFEGADDGEGDAGDLEALANGRIGAAIHLSGEGHGDHRALDVLAVILDVQEAPGEHDQVAHIAILRADPQHQCVLDDAAAAADAGVGFQDR
jgi:hypothetical protein